MEPHSASSSSDTSSGSRIEEASELLRLLCIADSNISVYSLSHPLATQSIQKAYEWLLSMIERRKRAVDINMTEDTLLFEGLRVEARNPRVARFSKKLIKIHANDLKFKPGIELHELTEFYNILTLKEEDIAQSGGIKKLLQSIEITHIAVSESKFVLVEDDERVVSRNAHVVEGPKGEKLNSGDEDKDSEIATYLLSQIRSQSVNHEWILNEMKNHPKKIVPLTIKAIEQAIKNPDSIKNEKETIESLISNIKTVGESLMDERDSDQGELESDGHEKLKEEILAMEAEIKARSNSLMSSEASGKFVNELLGVVQAYARQIKSNRIYDEFLKGETSMKKTESMLHTITSKTDLSEEMKTRLREHMDDEGLSEADVLEAVKRPKPKKRKKTFDQALHDGIEQRVSKLAGDSEKGKEAADKLTTFFSNKLTEKEKVHRKEVRKLKTTVSRHDLFLDTMDHGVLIWDSKGNVEYIDERAKTILGLKENAQIKPEMLLQVGQMIFPVELTVEMINEGKWDKKEIIFLTSIQTLILDANKNPTGILLK